MAAGELKMEVSLEATVHDAFKVVAEKMFKDHGLIVRNVDISWIDISTPAELRSMVDRVEIRTETIHRTDLICRAPKA